ncbi:MAG: phosphoribosylformylglycinamidine synthase subunit PurQ [Bacteroidetes bacterium]|nr:phosphoribosylformylglycinamidine synthase subunit PurQ [Bacteroidota bacterium]
MKFGVVVFPGSNCDQDVIYVLQTIMKQRVVQLWHKDSDLQNCDFIVLPGGFSFGDYLRSGAIARFSPIMEKVIEFANTGGNVLGICNGFQILCEAGLLPGALLHNNSQQFVSKNTFIKSQTANSRITAAINKNKALKIPVAHGEGRFYTDEETLKKLNAQDQILFRYCDENGQISDASNPNGSFENIAGICNHQRNVFGMMPHPERAADKELRNLDGKLIFDSILSLVKAY